MDRREAERRARELVERMTTAEKMTQLRYDSPAVDRLGIPAYNWWNEALHGVARAGTATSFPQAIGMGAAFDEEMMQEIGDTIATEGRAKYNAYSMNGDRDIYKGLTFWSPNVNIFRDPRWGRGQETYGEDPYLTGTLGCAFVRGLQGNGEYLKAAACAKHFAVHSGPEAIRHSFDAKASKKDMAETYLPAFRRLVTEADVESVMGCYNRVNGEPACGSKTLLEDLLRGTWKFEGHVVSDCWAIRDFHENHHVTEDALHSAAMAINNGCDLNCGDTYQVLPQAYADGLISEERITEAAVRLFTTRFLLGLFDETEYDDIPYTAVECPEHLALAQRAAEESIVLLKNNGVLPLDLNSIDTLGVVGPNADSRAALIGNYHGTSSEYITVLEGLRRIAPEDLRILYSEGCAINADRVEHLAYENDRLSEAMIVTSESDITIVVVGLNETLEGEEGDTGNSAASGDKADLSLPKSQEALLHAVAQASRENGKKTVLCLMAGSDMDLSYAQENFDAVLMLWYPGARGGLAAARILAGQVSPSGKLNVTFYDPDRPLPEFTDYSMTDRTYRYLGGKPQYPFGYGLTYGDVTVQSAELISAGDGSSPKVRVTYENGSDTDTKDVIQIYVDPVDSPDRTPNPRLCGFRKIYAPAGAKQECEIELDRETFRVVNEEGEYVSGGENYILYVGTSMPDPRSKELTGKECIALKARR
ncbi:MAG: glycoside hydrolase family 3 C-terminal domain-containing protein [Lachnospiraceae bacterium]|nr:glycoside hydrolase family 3 C-terminal domain-containing protein [Lachnospiraceae bacterium]